MAAQRGIDIILRVDSDGAGTYQDMAGGQQISLSFNKENVDITSQDDANRWRALLAAAGVKSFSITIRGVFKDAAADQTVRSYLVNDTHRNWRIDIPSFYRVQGTMSVTSLEYSGEHNGEVQHTFTLESAGEPTFTAL